MIEMFNITAKWRVLSYMLNDPWKPLFVSKMERSGQMSHHTMMAAIKILMPYGIVRESARSHFKNVYELDLEHPVVSALLKAYGISKILGAKPVELFREVDREIISLALIGDFMTEGWNEESEVEFVSVSESGEEIYDSILPLLEFRLERGVTIHQYNLDDWELMCKERSDPLMERCEENHLLFGDPLFYGSFE